ncbi:MAG: hydrolase Nlp/P60 [Flavobacteriales bacterium]|nr:MAG: hydrolase Nlp/P60 [Flavobacteriales bacterium]
MKAICNVTITPLRINADELSLMISQLLYGEKVSVMAEEKGFVKVMTLFDSVEAWVDKRHLTMISEEECDDENQRVCRESFYASGEEGQQLVLLGSELMGRKQELKTEVSEIVKTAHQLLNTPYLLGGRSVMGFDASGFIQMVFKVNGMSLPREVDKQSEMGESLFFLGENQAGDLAFFENEHGDICHVGLMLEDNRIIHVHDRVRIDQLDSSGIFNADEKRHTHKLRFVKRLITI